MTETIESIQIEQAAWCEGWRPSPLWLRLLGGPRSFYAGKERSYRMKWGELSLNRTGLAFRVGAYDTAHLNIALIFGQVFIRLPFLDRALVRGFGESPQFGFRADATTLHLNWGRRSVIKWFPWTLHHIKTEGLGADGKWFYVRPFRLGDEPREAPPVWSAEYPYHYMLDSGEVQAVTATVTRERATYGALWFGRGPISRALRSVFPKKVFDDIDIKFSDEVGSRRGSWKGGTIGCSYNMRPGETPRHTLNRMQAERRFR